MQTPSFTTGPRNVFRIVYLVLDFFFNFPGVNGGGGGGGGGQISELNNIMP